MKPEEMRKIIDQFLIDGDDFGDVEIDALDRTYDLLAIGEKMIDWDEDEVVFQISY